MSSPHLSRIVSLLSLAALAALALGGCSEPTPIGEEPGGGGGCVACRPGFICPLQCCPAQSDCIVDESQGGAGGGGGAGGAGGSGGSGGSGCFTCGTGSLCPQQCCAAQSDCVDDGTGGAGGSGGAGGGDPGGCNPACTPGQSCVDGTCISFGALGSDCAAAADCQSGICSLSATGPGLCTRACAAGCDAGFDCVSGSCVPAPWRACDAGSRCVSDVCTFWQLANGWAAGCSRPGQGAGDPGDVCNEAADCADGLCLHDPAVPGHCTIPCADEQGCQDGPFSDCLSSQLALAGGATIDALVCQPAAGGTLTYGACCATDADCDPFDSHGCMPSADGLTTSCSGWVCDPTLPEPDLTDQCFDFTSTGTCLPGPLGDYLCVANACF